MFVVYPWAAKTQHVTVDSIENVFSRLCMGISLYTDPEFTKIKHKNTLPYILDTSCVNF